MEPLFLQKERDLNKEAAYRVGRDSSSWEQDVTEKLYEEHPYLPDYDIQVKMRKADQDSGSGVGQITIDDKIRLPIIISDYKLQPLDLMYYNDELIPVTRDSIDNITQDGTVGKTIKPVSTGKDMGLRSATQAPHYGKYAYASALQYTHQDLADVIMAAYSEDGLKYDLEDSPLLKTALAHYSAYAGEVKEAEAPEAKVTIRLLKEASLTEVRSGGVKTLGNKGCVFKLANFDGTVTDQNFYVGTDGSYAYTQSVPGLVEEVKLAESTPKGEGVFYARIGDEYVCTQPLTVLFKTADYLAATTGLGEKLEIRMNDEFSGWKKVANCLYLSNDWKFHPIKDRAHFSSAVDLNKVAALGSDFEVRRVGRFYMVTGDLSNVPELAKIADTPVNRIELQNGFTAYCSPEEFDDVVKEADRAIAAKIKTYAPDPETGDVVEIPKVASAEKVAFFRVAGILTDEVIKTAGVEPQDAERTIDVVLGLNFLNKQNVYRMLEGIDDLVVARAVLSRVLLAGRLGLDIDVGTIRTAVFALDAVIKDLKRLRQSHLVD